MCIHIEVMCNCCRPETSQVAAYVLETIAGLYLSAKRMTMFTDIRSIITLVLLIFHLEIKQDSCVLHNFIYFYKTVACV